VLGWTKLLFNFKTVQFVEDAACLDGVNLADGDARVDDDEIANSGFGYARHVADPAEIAKADFRLGQERLFLDPADDFTRDA